MNKKRLVAALVASALGLPGAAMATNGYFANGYGTISKGMVGAGSAMPEEAMAAATNPASGVLVGNQLQLGLELFAPYRGYENMSGGGMPFGSGEVNSDKTLFEIPSFAVNMMLDQDNAVGFAMYGNGGMNTTYRTSDTGTGQATFGAPVHTTGVDLMQLFMNLNYSHKLSDRVSVGAAAIVAAQRFAARGFSNFAAFSSDSSNLTDRGFSYSFGGGIKLGVEGELAPGWSAAASYQSRIYMSKFDEYKGLFAEQGGFDIPPTATLGLAWKPNSDLAFAFDVQKIWYSKIASVANPMYNSGGGLNSLGTDNGAGFGWRDMTVYKLGAQWKSSPKWTWRAGVSTTKQPIPSTDVLFNVVAPATVQTHYAVGFTHALSKNSELNFAFTYVPNKPVVGSGGTFGASSIKLFMHQYDAELGWALRF